MLAGSATNLDGHYTISGLPAGSYTVRVTFVGYTEFEQTVTLTTGQTMTFNVPLVQGGFDLNMVVVTASKRQEKVLDAPASISVLAADELESSVALSSVSVLSNTTGVDVSQTGIDRRELVLRGFNNAFSGATYVLTDYRQASAPSLGVNIYAIMPNMSIDLDRIEVVRGPGSALYGAGVDAGVVHFFTKDAFSQPGMTVSIMGGERSMFGVDARVAGVVNDNIGLKLTGSFGQADDWAFDPADPADRAQLDDDRVYTDPDDVPDNQEVEVIGTDSLKLQRNPDYRKVNVNGTVEYRIPSAGNLTVTGGISRYDATVLSGIGTLQADNFGYMYGQVRYQQGGFFAQAYVNQNDVGDSYVYGSGDVVFDESRTINGQVQYNLGLSGERHQLVFGGDVEVVNPETDGTIYGRFEDDDQVAEYGIYSQGTFALTSQFDATLALRGDYNNVVEQFQLSPRAAIVYKPAPGHSLRASFNRAFSSPGNNSLFLDIVAAEVGPVRIRGLGSNAGWTWRRNAAFEPIAGTDLVGTSLNPATLGLQTPAGLPLDAVYASVHNGLAQVPTAQLVALLAANGIVVDEPTAAQLVALLAPANTSVLGFTRGQIARLNPAAETAEDRFVAIDASTVSDIDPLEQTITQTYEVGYKGIVQNRILIAIDAYHAHKENFVGPLGSESPWVLVPDLAADLTSALASGITDNATLAGALQGLGVSPAQAAALVVGLAGGGLPDGNTPVAIVEAVENAVAPGNAPEAFLSYRNFGRIDYQGVDISLQFIATDEVTVFGNLSFVSDDFFDSEELGEDDPSLSVALNAPKFKGKFGAHYAKRGGFSAGFAGRYTDTFPVSSGPYVGEVPSFFLLDLSAGYDFSNNVAGLRLDVTVQNVLDEEHRQFVGAPLLGRVAMARLTYTM
jgi:iron complex outermembrane receptor protein